MEQQRYKLTEAARILGISPWTLRRMVYAGKVPYIKEETGHIYIPASWIALKSQPQRSEEGGGHD
jgi:predicted site-specific integrase-resolvase